MRLPDFIIAGTQKGGTTALNFYLRQHPDIYMEKHEINYYSLRYHMGKEWYMKHFPDDGRITGEKTPDYMSHTEAPKRIYEDIPDVKLIFMLRNPVDRAYSEYWMWRLDGREKRPFSKAWREYTARGRYAEQIERYLQFFEREQLLFIVSEDFYKNRDNGLQEVYDFLGVKNVDIDNLRDVHTGGKAKYKAIKKITYLLAVAKRKSPFLWTKKLIQQPLWILKALNKKKYPPMKEATRKEMEEYFREYNRRLQEIIGIDTEIWWYE